eukprot:scaffold32178_cov54-Attheya_sp.AAC.8
MSYSGQLPPLGGGKYGSTDNNSNNTLGNPFIGSSLVPAEQESQLFGEGFIPTDNEEETPPTSASNLRLLDSSNFSDQTPDSLAMNFDAEESLMSPSNHLFSADEFQQPYRPSPETGLAGCLSNVIGDRLLNVHGTYRVSSGKRVAMAVTLLLSLYTLPFFLSSIGFVPWYRKGRAPKIMPVPFPMINRVDYGDPVSGIIEKSLFHPSLLIKPSWRSYAISRVVAYSGNHTHERNPPRGPFLKVPFPTGAFWTNFVLQPTTDHETSYPIVAYPYAFKWAPSLLQASYPPLRRRTDAISIRDTFNPDLTFGTAEEVIRRHIVAFDPLSVTVRYETEGGGYWESFIVMGSPYITIKYHDATPIFTPLSIFKFFVCPRDEDGNYKNGVGVNHQKGDPNERRTAGNVWGVCSKIDNGQHDNTGPPKPTILQGVQFLFQTQENLNWLVFSSEPISLSFDNISKRTVSSLEKFTGVIRIALIPPPLPDAKNVATGGPVHDNIPLSTSSGVRRLIYHSYIYPTGGKVTWDFSSTSSNPIAALASVKKISAATTLNRNTEKAEKIATIKFHYTTATMTENSSTNRKFQYGLLMMSLPHHAQLMDSSSLLMSGDFDLVYNCIKGAMTPVVGDIWSYDEPLSPVKFDDLDAASALAVIHPRVRHVILDNIEKDLKMVLPTLDENIYGFGKQVARIAQLAHIADQMVSSGQRRFKKGNRTIEDPAISIRDNAISSLYEYLSEFLQDNGRDKLLYDTQLGGIVTEDGLLNPQADFGNGRYLLYACAVMGKLNATFVNEFGPYVDALLYDVAHSSNSDSTSADEVFFPFARHKSWFDGHSFASGLFPFGNGKSQESSSEAVNCYYGAYLWSLVRWGESDDINKRTDFIALLLAMEIRGAKEYWHMLPNVASTTNPSVYDEQLTKNYMVGNLGMLDVTCSTWFGSNKLYVHMINFMPVTAITRVLFDQRYIEEEYEKVIKPLMQDTVEMPWRGYTIADHAMVDPVAAWEEAQNLESYRLDSAISKSQVLYWILSRGGSNFSPFGNSTELIPDKSSDSSGSASCESYEACAALNLTGVCCPTHAGISLGCCNARL